MHWLNERMEKFGQKVCFMAEYFLPDMNRFKVLECKDYTIKVLEKPDFENLYLPQWDNALCEKRKECDVLCVGAYDGDKLIALAGASADCEEMYLKAALCPLG